MLTIKLKTSGFVKATLYFVNKVKPGGDWDFKSQDDWNLNPDTVYSYESTELRYDDIGNIHYGYVGRVLFPQFALLTGGGLVQIYAGTSSWDFIYSKFDDPRDQEMIAFGCFLWEVGLQ